MRMNAGYGSRIVPRMLMRVIYGYCGLSSGIYVCGK